MKYLILTVVALTTLNINAQDMDMPMKKDMNMKEMMMQEKMAMDHFQGMIDGVEKHKMDMEMFLDQWKMKSAESKKMFSTMMMHTHMMLDFYKMHASKKVMKMAEEKKMELDMMAKKMMEMSEMELMEHMKMMKEKMMKKKMHE